MKSMPRCLKECFAHAELNLLTSRFLNYCSWVRVDARVTSLEYIFIFIIPAVIAAFYCYGQLGRWSDKKK